MTRAAAAGRHAGRPLRPSKRSAPGRKVYYTESGTGPAIAMGHSEAPSPLPQTRILSGVMAVCIGRVEMPATDDANVKNQQRMETPHHGRHSTATDFSRRSIAPRTQEPGPAQRRAYNDIKISVHAQPRSAYPSPFPKTKHQRQANLVYFPK